MKYAEHFRALRDRHPYDCQNALSLAVACQLAYEKKSVDIQSCVKGWGYRFYDFISRRKKFDIDTQCFVMHDAENIVVVFRGSDSTRDWFANFQAAKDPKPLKDTEAHEGFQDARFQEQLNERIAALKEFVDMTDKRLGVGSNHRSASATNSYINRLIDDLKRVEHARR